MVVELYETEMSYVEALEILVKVSIYKSSLFKSYSLLYINKITHIPEI